MEGYAIKNPDGQIITWTCFLSQGHPWLTYMDHSKWTDFGRKRVEELKTQGYSEVRVRICELEAAK